MNSEKTEITKVAYKVLKTLYKQNVNIQAVDSKIAWELIHAKYADYYPVTARGAWLPDTVLEISIQGKQYADMRASRNWQIFWGITAKFWVDILALVVAVISLIRTF